MDVPRRRKILDELRLELRSTREDLPETLPETAHFKDDLELDSLDVVEFVARTENLYRFHVPDEDWQLLTTLGLVADYVMLHLEVDIASDTGPNGG